MTDDRAAIAELMEASKPGQPHVLLHYLYFPRESAARNAANKLCHYGFHTEERLGAEGVTWLVLARHDIVPTEAAISAARQLMESLAESCNGEYDGWEAEVRK